MNRKIVYDDRPRQIGFIIARNPFSGMALHVWGSGFQGSEFRVKGSKVPCSGLIDASIFSNLLILYG